MGDSGALLVCGATSGAGKSTVAAGLCRSLARRGRQVAPFKAQNMSNHAAVTADGGEVGRAQAMQASAAGVALDRRMNPILLKPGPDGAAHVVVMGDEVATTDARAYGDIATGLRSVVLDALTSLRRDHDWVIAEGAGGAAEINLIERDLVNLPLARAAGIPALLVVDIDAGGAFAAAHGTIDLLPDELRARVAGVVFNRFRGDVSLLADGIAALEARDGVPVLGVLPYLVEAPVLGCEDSLDITAGSSQVVRSRDPVRVVAIRLPHLANPSDLDPFVAEPDVELRWITRPSEAADADVIVIPGSRATVSDLGWIRSVRFDRLLARSDAAIVGLCAGYQMLGRRIHDRIESGVGSVDGLGLLDVDTTFAVPKIVCRSVGQSATGHRIDGYQIRYGRPAPAAAPWVEVDGADEGATAGRVTGTSLHGLFDADAFRAEFLAAVATDRGRSYAPASVSFAEALDAQQERLADWVDGHLDVARLESIAAAATSAADAPGW